MTGMGYGGMERVIRKEGLAFQKEKEVEARKMARVSTESKPRDDNFDFEEGFVEGYLANFSKYTELMDEVADWRHMAMTAANQECTNGENHCSCVGALRKQCLDLTDRLHTMDQELQLVAKDAIVLVHAYSTDNRPPGSIVKRYSGITEWVSRDSQRGIKL